MYLALPKGHPLAKRKVVPLAALEDEEWLVGSKPSTCGAAVVTICREAGFEPRIGFETDDYHVMQGFIAAGLGATLLPDLALSTLRPDVVVRADRPAGHRAPRVGDNPRRGRPLAGHRRDGRDSGRGRRTVRGRRRAPARGRLAASAARRG